MTKYGNSSAGYRKLFRYSPVWYMEFISAMVAALSLSLYAQQNNPLTWIPGVSVLFFIYYRWCFSERKIKSITLILFAGFLLRFLFLFHVPSLSDDYSRFIWDGKLNASGNTGVYEFTPEELMTKGSKDVSGENRLYDKLNSKNYYSVYPPVSQVVFTIGVLTGITEKGAVVVFRLIIWLCELILFFLILNWLKKEKVETSRVGWYFLNPLIITEWSGSLHFEGIMVMFLVAAIVSARKNHWIASSLWWAGAVAAKLIPLMFIPVLWKRISFTKTLLFGLVVCILVVVSFVPFVEFSFGNGLFSSLDLYFRKFEFNGSIYILLREIITPLTGYNPNIYLSPLLSVFTIFCMMFLYFRHKEKGWTQLLELMLILWMIFYFLSPVVHPWYITSLVVFASLTGRLTPVVWSGLIFLSYFLYYENSVLMQVSVMLLQYGIVYWYFYKEYNEVIYRSFSLR